jgi:hypothetical protein
MTNTPMADERETAQWFMAAGAGKSVIDALPEPVRRRCYNFGALVAWRGLPDEAREALRRRLYENRTTCYQHGREYVAGCVVCDECKLAVQA